MPIISAFKVMIEAIVSGHTYLDYFLGIKTGFTFIADFDFSIYFIEVSAYLFTTKI